ncbi:DEAD/DEAH box helicase family protein [Mycoplasmopsis bovis]|uniref:DEAD/DEAH box helicase family protein n=1 Tax=Mycoplasmopsis bovis TaxID=28903 RepID=UPI003D26E209
MQLSNTQNKAVCKIIDKYDQDKKKILEFQAPTGSGKTFMIINVIDKLITEYPNEKFTFAIATLSSADLPKQMLMNFTDYKQYLYNSHNISIELQESPSSKSTSNKAKDQHFQILAKQNNVLILGTQSFGKGRIFTEQGIINSYLSQIENEGYKLVYIRDEAHIGGETGGKYKSSYVDLDEDIDFKVQLANAKKDEQRFELLMQNAAHFIIKMTATPKGKNELVHIRPDDLLEDDLILLKHKSHFNYGLDESKSDVLDDEQILKTAINKFKLIQKEYLNDPFLKTINPAMLIQVKSKQNDKSEEFAKDINDIINIIKESGLTYVKFFGQNDVETNIRLANKSLKSISKNNSDVDVVIFKIGPATGWNIPRACMLVQLRKVCSPSLSTQTIGRIMRNPNPEFIKDQNHIGLQYYYYSNIENKSNNRITYRLKDEFKSEQFKVAYIDKEVVKTKIKNPSYYENIIETLDFRHIYDELKKYQEYYKTNGYINYGTERFGSKTYVNLKIFNSIELELRKELFLAKNKMYFNTEIIEEIEQLFHNNIVRLAKDDENSDELHNLLSKNLFWLIVEQNFLSDIKKGYYKELSENNSDGVYKVKLKSLPEVNDLVYSEIDQNRYLDIEGKAYAYVNSTAEKKESNYFDSDTEVEFATLVNKYIHTWSENNNYKVQLWTKNPVFDGIYVEYFKQNNEVARSFPDFIFRIVDRLTNKTIHNFYIEVKSDNDINEEKSNQLIDAYHKYMSYIDSENQNKDMTLLLVKLKKAKNRGSATRVHYSGYSSISEINYILAENKQHTELSELSNFFEIVIKNAN